MNGELAVVYQAVLTALALVLVSLSTSAGEFAGASGVLPAGTELGDEALDRPREMFRSEVRGGRPAYLALLGDVAFNWSPTSKTSISFPTPAWGRPERLSDR